MEAAFLRFIRFLKKIRLLQAILAYNCLDNITICNEAQHHQHHIPVYCL